MYSKIVSKWSILGIGGIILVSMGILFFTKSEIPSSIVKDDANIPASYQGNIIKETQANTNFRRVIFTGNNSQLVVMSIPPGNEVGEETHAYTEQTLFFLSGVGEGILNDKQFPIGPGDAVVVVPGTKHNFKNNGREDLKVYTVYAPPNHIDGRVHRTKAEADADMADEAFGEVK